MNAYAAIANILGLLLLFMRCARDSLPSSLYVIIFSDLFVTNDISGRMRE